MSISKAAFLPVIISLLSSCDAVTEITYKVDFDITSPKSSWLYYNNAKVLLALDINTRDIVWNSSADGFLGSGNHILVFLSPGRHTLTAEVLGVKKTTDVYIAQRDSGFGEEVKTLINYSPLEVLLARGKQYPYLVSLDGVITGFHAESPNMQRLTKNTRCLYQEQDSPLRDIRLSVPANNGTNLITDRKIKSRLMYKKAPVIGETRKFFVGPNFF
jgi:hypothetical protein